MQDKLSQTFAALADPTRRAMLAQLAQGDANVSELAQPWLKKMSLPAITKHVQVLERAGLVTKSKDAQTRRCRLRASGLREATGWVDQYRIYWEESFDRLDAYLKKTTEKKSTSKSNKG
jgi:DNA-binding transcriptional ArsR family regulator